MASPAIGLVGPARRWAGIALLGLALVAGAAATSYTGRALSVAQLVAYGLAVAALILAARCLDAASPTVELRPTTPFTRLDGLLLGIATAVAAILRVFALDSVPGHVMADEVPMLANVAELLRGNLASPFASGHLNIVYAHLYGVAAATFLIPDRALALRAPGVLLGILSVPLLYLLLRHLFTRPLAFVASLLLALSSWHLTLSRTGYVFTVNNVSALLALYWLVRGLHSRQLRHFVFSGLGLGVGVLYLYVGTLVPVVVVLFGGYLLLLHRHLFSRRVFLGFVMLSVAAAIVAGPRLYLAFRSPDLTGRANQVSVFSPPHSARAGETIPRQLKEILISFNYRTDEDGRAHPRDREGLLDPVTAAAFGLGGLYALLRVRTAGWALLVLTFLVLVLPSVFSAGQTNWATAWRAIGVIPALFGLAAAPFAAVWQLAGNRALARGAMAGLLALALGAIGALNYHYYFDIFPAKSFWGTGVAGTHTRAAERILAASPETRLLVNQDLTGYFYFQGLLGDRRPFETFTWPGVNPLPPFLADDVRPTLVIGSAQIDYERLTASGTLGDLLAHYYPDGTRQDKKDRRGQPLYSAFLLQADQIRAAHGLSVSYRPAAPGTAPAAVPSTTVDWQTSLTGAFPFAAELSGTLVVPAEGTYELTLAGPAKQHVALNGRPWRQGFLLAGLYQIAIQTEVDGPVQARLTWRRDGGAAEPVPSSLVLRRGLPPWGIVEQITPAAGAAEPLERWLPVLWLERPGPLPVPWAKLGAQPPKQIQWSGEVEVAAAGDYRLFLNPRTRATATVDGSPLPPPPDAGQPWQVRLATGRHPFRIAVETPDRYGFLAFWIGPGERRELIGGARTLAPPGLAPSAPAPAAAWPAESPGGRPPEQPLARPATMLLKPQLVIGGSQNAESQPRQPRGVAVAPDGSVFVADTGNARIQKYDPVGKLLLGWGRPGEGDAEFFEPVALAVNPRGELVVLDAKSGWIRRFDSFGRPLGKIGGPSTGVAHPRGLGIDREGNVFIADTGGSRIVVLRPDGSVRQTLGVPGSGAGQLRAPTDVLPLSDGHLLVMDTGNGRVQRLTAEGTFVSEGVVGPNNPVDGPHLTQAPNGSVYLTDPERHRVLHLDGGLGPRAAFGGKGAEPGQFRWPVGIGVDRQGAVYVADTFNHRIQRFQP